MADPMNLPKLRKNLATILHSKETRQHERDTVAWMLDTIDAAVFVPGLWHCQHCQFTLVAKTLHAHSGAVTARASAGELCPNCQTALDRVTYKDAFDEQQQRFEQYLMDAIAEREARESQLNARTGYVPGQLDRTAPARIWLQIDTIEDNDQRDEPWPGTDGVTWQDESIGGLEIQYVRADLVSATARPELQVVNTEAPTHG